MKPVLAQRVRASDSLYAWHPARHCCRRSVRLRAEALGDGQLPYRGPAQHAPPQRASALSAARDGLLEQPHTIAAQRLEHDYATDFVHGGLSGAVLLSTPRRKPKRLRLAVDVDEVLGRFVYQLNKFCKDEYGMEYSVDDYWVYEFAKIWGCTQDRSNHIVHEFFKSPHFCEGIPVVPGSSESLSRLAKSCDLVVVTSRQHVIQDVTLEWVNGHFPGLFTDVFFGNHWAKSGASKKKSEICRDVNADVLIDDNPVYAMECAQAGIDVLLYDWNLSYPWAKLPEGGEHPRIRVVADWRQVEAAVEVLSGV